jgi:hypothetical protein
MRIEYRPRSSYATASSTIAAFKYLVRLGDRARIEAFVPSHPFDATSLLKIYEKERRDERS